MNNKQTTFRLNWPEIWCTLGVSMAIIGFEAWAFFG